MANSKAKINYFGPWAAFFFLNWIGMFILGFLVIWIIPVGLALFGIEFTLGKTAYSIIGFIVSLPVSYYLFYLSVSSFLVPQIQKKDA